MSVPKHTPGPWVAVGHEVHDSRSAFDASGARIGNTPNRICGVEYPYGDSAGKAANAHLVAAAPELLEALQTAELILREHGLRAHGGYKEIEAAIAKATGGGA